MSPPLPLSSYNCPRQKSLNVSRIKIDWPRKLRGQSVSLLYAYGGATCRHRITRPRPGNVRARTSGTTVPTWSASWPPFGPSSSWPSSSWVTAWPPSWPTFWHPSSSATAWSSSWWRPSWPTSWCPSSSATAWWSSWRSSLRPSSWLPFLMAPSHERPEICHSAFPSGA